MKKTFTGKNLRAKMLLAVKSRITKYIPDPRIRLTEAQTSVKIPSLYSDTSMGFGCHLKK